MHYMYINFIHKVTIIISGRLNETCTLYFDCLNSYVLFYLFFNKMSIFVNSVNMYFFHELNSDPYQTSVTSLGAVHG